MTNTDTQKDSSHTQCRIQWKSLITGHSGHGGWSSVSKEDVLKEQVDKSNKEHTGVINHWLEYK